VTAALVLGAIAIAQASFLLLLFVFLLVRRTYDRRIKTAFAAARAGLSAPLQDWLVAGGHPEPVVAVLRTMPRGTAVGYLALLARQAIPEADRDGLSRALRGERWVESAVRQRGSRFWWRRLEAARALSLMAESRDREMVIALFEDEHPAVQIAAATALPRVIDEAVVSHVLDHLDGLPKVVRHFATTVLRRSRALVGPALAKRIGTDARFSELASWIELADAIDDPGAIAAAMLRADHPAAAVRRTIGRALRRHPGPAAETVLVRLLGDTDSSVRAAAARTLGELGSRGAVPDLAKLLSDDVWVVRVRAAVSLAQAGERGRAALRAARVGGDRFARDMATMVSGLSDGAILEMGDA
jgi:HEAT repeat protein